MNSKTEKDLLEAAQYAATLLSKIPAFGDGIGKKVSKAELGIAHGKLMLALTANARENQNTLPTPIGD